jgi:hypothetical protein
VRSLRQDASGKKNGRPKTPVALRMMLDEASTVAAQKKWTAPTTKPFSLMPGAAGEYGLMLKL